MNLLFLPKVYPRASVIGGPILIHHRIKNLSQMGHRITVLAPGGSREDHEDRSLEPYCEDIRLFDSPGPRTDRELEKLQAELGRPPFFLSGDGAYNPLLEETLFSLIRSRPVDAVLAEYSMMGQYLEGAGDRIPDQVQTVISVHECYTRAFQQRAEKGEPIPEETIRHIFDYEFKMYRSVDRVLTLTPEDRETLICLAPDLRDKIVVVPHGVDTDFYVPALNRPEGRKHILFLGNFRHHPNVDAVQNFMAHCWGRISREVPDARFHAIGYDPPPELLELRSDRVIVREGGAHTDVRSTYWNSDLFVAPIELGGGFRGKMLEALACGLPIVSTHLAAFGINPVLGKEMFLTDDYDRFAEYVIRLLRDEGLRRQMSAMARALGERFDHRNAAKKLDQTLKS